MMVAKKILMSVSNGVIKQASMTIKKSLGSIDDAAKSINKNELNNNFNTPLFKGFKDIDEFIPNYDNYDVALSPSLNRKLHNKANAISTNIIDTDLASTKIIGTNKTVYLDTLTTNRCKWNDFILKQTSEGHPFNECVNIFYKAFQFTKNEKMLKDIMSESFSIIKQGYPLEYVLKSIKTGFLNNGRYAKGLMSFIVDNPSRKAHVVLKNNSGVEIFDATAANCYHILDTICKNETIIPNILNDCRINFKTEKELLDLATKLLKKQNGEWNSLNSQIFKTLKKQTLQSDKNVTNIDNRLYNLVNGYINNGYSTEAIILKLNQLGALRK